MHYSYLFSFSLAILLCVALNSSAAPIRRDALPTPTSSKDIDSYVTAARFALSAYCENLHVGGPIGADGTILYAAGNGQDVQRVYVAHSPSHGIVVAYQGTNVSSLQSISNDLDFALVGVDARLLFLDNHANVNKGFQDQWLKTADDVLDHVRTAFNTYPDSDLLVTGHSLGASLAQLAAAYISHNVDVNATRLVTFGQPRTGDRLFAVGLNKYVVDQHHITNYRDPIPHLPDRLTGYEHPSGEVWISGASGNDVVDCAGQENANCADSLSALQYDQTYHDGPYFGVSFAC